MLNYRVKCLRGLQPNKLYDEFWVNCELDNYTNCVKLNCKGCSEKVEGEPFQVFIEYVYHKSLFVWLSSAPLL